MDDEGASRVRNTKRNIRYGLMQMAVSFVLPLVVRTILIRRFGVDYLGLNSLFASILGVLSLMELGFGSAVVFSLYKPVAEGDIELICSYLAYYRKAYRVVGILVLFVGLALMPFLGLLVRDATPPGGLSLRVCYLIFLADAVLNYLLFGYMTEIPMAHQRRDVLSRMDMAMGVLQCLVRCAVLLASDNFYLYLVSIPVVTAVRNLLTAAVVRRRYPRLGCRGTLDDDRRKDLNTRVRGLLVDRLAAVTRNGVDALCISALVGLAANGMYSNYYYVMSGAIALSTMLLGSMSASVGNSVASESRDKNYSDMRKFDFIYTSLAGWATACMLCLCQPFMRAWLGDDMMLGTPVVIALCAYFYVLKSGDIRWLYHEGAGLWYEGRLILVGEAVANVILNVVLCGALGVLGVVTATVVTVTVTNSVFFPRLLFDRYFGNGRLREYCVDHVLYALTMLAGACAGWFACEAAFPVGQLAAGGVVCLGGRLAVCTILSWLVFWAAWHRSGRYATAMSWLRRVLARRR